MKRIGIYVGVLGNGGIESAVISQLEMMDHSRYCFDVIIDTIVKRREYETIIKNHGGNVVSLNLQKATRIGYKYKKYQALKHLIKEKQYDCFHFHSSFPSSLLYGILTYKQNVPSLVTSHASGPAKMSCMNKIVQSISRKLFPNYFTYRIAVSEVAGKWMFGQHSFSIIHNAVDIKKFHFNQDKRQEIRNKLGLHDDDLVLGQVGRFVPEKNHSFTVRVFEELHKLCPKSKLLLIGSGPGKNKIDKLLKDVYLFDYCFNVDRTEHVEDYLCAMDCMIFPSVREGFGLVTIEAQSTNLPVLASDTIPKETKASDLISYLPLRDSPIIWAQAINKEFSERNDRSVPIDQDLKDNYSLQNIVEDIEEYYGN